MGPLILPPAPTAEVMVADGVSFTVRGFSFDDALRLYYRHAGVMSALFDSFRDKVDTSTIDIAAVGTTLVSTAPQVMAEVVAVGAGQDPDSDGFDAAVETLRRYPAGVLLDALTRISAMTFTSEMPPGKFAAVVIGLAQSATAKMTGRAT